MRANPLWQERAAVFHPPHRKTGLVLFLVEAAEGDSLRLTRFLR